MTETKGGQTRTLTSDASPGLTRLYRSPAIGCPLNVDGATGVVAATDGIALLRYALGLRGAALVGAQIGANNITALVTKDYIDTRLAQLDMDGDGRFDTTDAIVAVRYQLGFRDSALISGLTLAGSRTSGSAVQSFIQNMGCGI